MLSALNMWTISSARRISIVSYLAQRGIHRFLQFLEFQWIIFCLLHPNFSLAAKCKVNLTSHYRRVCTIPRYSRDDRDLIYASISAMSAERGAHARCPRYRLLIVYPRRRAPTSSDPPVSFNDDWTVIFGLVVR